MDLTTKAWPLFFPKFLLQLFSKAYLDDTISREICSMRL